MAVLVCFSSTPTPRGKQQYLDVSTAVTSPGFDSPQHSFLAKFCSMKPGIYTEYTTDLVRKARRGNSHTFHSLLGFNPMALASLVIRITVIAIRDIRELIDEGEIAITRVRGAWTGMGDGRWRLLE